MSRTRATASLLCCLLGPACQRNAASPLGQACQSTPAVAPSASSVVASSKDKAAKSEPREHLHTYFDLEFRHDDTKFAVEGPFYIGDPVHETITLLAVHDAGYANGESSADVPDLIRGVFWNDDPCAQLFNDQHEGLQKSTGLEWYLDFRAAGKSAKEGKPLPKLVCPLLGRSHFGDLQFLHGMANGDGVPAKDTYQKIFSWLRFTYVVASGEVDAMSELATSAPDISQLIKLGPNATCADIFYADSRPIAQERALGSLLHLIQDSFAAGHTNRKANNGCRGEIVQFYSYANQDHGKHSEDDSWRGSGEPRERVKAIQGGPEALTACQQVLSMKKQGQPWTNVEQYLANGPLLLSSTVQASGPGEGFRKK